MSSALAKFSQIPVRAKFLIILRGLQPGQFDADVAAAFSLEEGKQWGVDVGTVVAAAELNSIAAPVDLSGAVGRLYRDLGRQIMVVDAAGAHQALFREAIRQASADNEGVLEAPIWLCVWRADGSQVAVARTG
jgi:hypothetical protein